MITGDSLWQEVVDADAHRAVHRVAGNSDARPSGPLLTRCRWLSAKWQGGEDDGELLPYLAVPGVEDHVLRVGVDSHDAGDCALDPRLLERLADSGPGD